MTATVYHRLPELPPQAPTETREAYGLRAFCFVLATDTTATVDDDALELASHVYRVAIANRELLPASIDRLAETDRTIRATLRRRTAAATQTAPTPAQDGAGRDTPNAGPMAPLSPRTPALPPASGRAGHPGAITRPTPAPVLTRADFEF